VRVLPAILRASAIVLTIVLVLYAGVGGIRWAKRASTGAQLMANAMMLVLGWAGPPVKPPQQEIEEAREDKGSKGAESGDPPTV